MSQNRNPVQWPRVVAAAALGLFLMTAPLLAQDRPLATAQGVAANIHRVVAGGYWSSGKDEGFFRAVVVAGGVETVAHRLYIQWLKVDPDKQTYRLVRTQPVKEVNGGHGYVLKIAVSFPVEGKMSITAEARSPRGGAAKKFVITVKAVGGYEIKTR